MDEKSREKMYGTLKKKKQKKGMKKNQEQT